MRRLFGVLFPLVLLVLLPGCLNFRNMGKDLTTGLMDGIRESPEDSVVGLTRGAGRGLMDGINEKAPDVTRGLMAGVGEGLRKDVLGDATDDQIEHTLDRAGDRAAAKLEQLTAVLDKLLATLGTRSEQLSRGLMRGAGNGLGNDVLTVENQEKLNLLVGQLTGTAREQLLGQRTHDQLVAIVRDALAQASTAVDEQREKLKQDAAEAEVKFRNALIGIGALVLLAGGVIGFLIWLHRRNQRLLQLLTMQINKIPDQKSYDELVGRIRNLASATGLEPVLRSELKKQGLLRS